MNIEVRDQQILSNGVLLWELQPGERWAALAGEFYPSIVIAHPERPPISVRLVRGRLIREVIEPGWALAFP